MPCYHPVTMYRLQERHHVSGKYLVVHHPTRKQEANIREKITRPCGGCVGCRLSKSSQWAIRCMHEASLHQSNSFITLTYNNQALPEDHSLHHEHFQNFMKRLRDRLDYIPLRYYMCGEYGEQLGRPHYHACLFGYDFPDKQLWRVVRGNNLYISPMLMDLWPDGFSTIGSMTFESAAYVARYVMKKVTGKKALEHYEYFNQETGEITLRTPEYNQPSLKPGLAKGWFDQYQKEVYPHDKVVINGKLMAPPKYYDRCYENLYPADYQEILIGRLDKSKLFSEHTTTERLAVREQVKLAQISTLKRGMQNDT